MSYRAESLKQFNGELVDELLTLIETAHEHGDEEAIAAAAEKVRASQTLAYVFRSDEAPLDLDLRTIAASPNLES